MNGYKIESPQCGRDEKGIFHCECGKCEAKTMTSTDYKKILDNQLQLLIEEQKHGFSIDTHDRIVSLAKGLLILTPADSPPEP